MDRIPQHPYPPFSQFPATSAESAKTPGDYLAAVMRRAWLLASVTFMGFLFLAAVVIRMPDKYQAMGELLVESPKFDGHVSGMMESSIDRRSSDENDTFVPNKVARLRSRGLATRVGLYEEVRQDGTEQDVADEIVEGLNVRPQPGTNIFVLSLKGANAARVTTLLEKLMTTFSEEVNREVEDRIRNSREHVASALAAQNRELRDIQDQIQKIVVETRILTPKGESLLERQYQNLREALIQKRAKIDAMEHQAQAAKMKPDLPILQANGVQERIRDLRIKEDMFIEQAQAIQRTAKNSRRDPALVEIRNRLTNIQEQIQEYEAMAEPPPVRLASDLPDFFLESLRDDAARTEAQLDKINQEIQKSMPRLLEFQTLEEERKRKIQSIEELERQLSNFEILTKTRSQPVTITVHPVQPVKPVWPPRKALLVLSLVASFAGGVCLVLLLEHSDKTVRSPERIADLLNLPLYGVVPRIRRHPMLQRGGHLWTTAVPQSLEADSYRNLRASILGGSRNAPASLRQILVTSAKAGEGKSTTALNLAATFARAGERTILVDADLRRPSLGGLVGESPDHPGLVDVLRGLEAWQEVVRGAEIPHLDLMTTGRVGDTPIEILGSRELRQLLAGLAKHYDRVILDGPAVLGLADCRMLGQIVDGCLLVVRANPRNIHPIQRAKVMLEQSQVPLMGVVYNGLTEDYRNWSSYGAPAAQVARGPAIPMAAEAQMPMYAPAGALVRTEPVAYSQGNLR
ncbi:polysaccharide biosynthesis tyrosine autokinase [bacterium]|nr:polysaccharide biosynthesis tyrosine autokinase [bacterium]